MNAHENNNRLPGGFTAEIATDLSSGRVVDLAEVYALNAVDDAERASIEQFLASAPAADRAAFNERVRQARETLATSFTAEEEPPPGLLDRIMSSLPAQTAGQSPAVAHLPGTGGDVTPGAPHPLRDTT